MVDQGAMFEIENYLKNHTITWGIDERVFIMIGLILVIAVIIYLWFKKKKKRKEIGSYWDSKKII